MPKTPKAIYHLPPVCYAALEKLGADLAVARLRRRESLATWAKRLGCSVPTLLRMESGDPGVSMGIWVSALWLVQLHDSLAELASPEKDRGALTIEVRMAFELGKARARASAEARIGREEKARRATEDPEKC